ncbi:MAG: histone deacetylase family protein [Bacteroidota bacterium]
MLKIAYNDFYVQPLPPGHRFPMEKYDLLQRQLLHEGTVDEAAFFSPSLIDQTHVLKVHKKDYFDRLRNLDMDKREQRKSGFPHDERLIQREQTIMEGTRRCAEIALETGASMNIAGGTHHAYADRAEGFCLLNDQAIAAQWLLDHTAINQILIIDLDVHQGNGTASIFDQEPRIFTFSMHGEKNYPMHKEKSNLDIPLRDGIEDKDYLYHLEYHLDEVLSNFTPDFLFFQSGVDIIATDRLGRLNVSIDGCRQRDAIVFRLAKQMDVPIVASMGGGYSKEIKYIIEAHANTYRTAQHILF